MPNVRDLKVLVVDDFATMRRIINSLLREMGVGSVIEAENGAHAFASIVAAHDAGRQFDLVVTDINMPQMNGIELLGKIKDDPRFKKVPVLMITAEAHREDIVRVAQAGAAGYIVKPFTRTTLEAKIRLIFEKLGNPITQ